MTLGMRVRMWAKEAPRHHVVITGAVVLALLLPELVQQALHHGRFVAFRRHLDEAETLHRISSPEAANRDEQIQIGSNPIRYEGL